MSDDIRPTADDLARDLRADLEWFDTVKQSVSTAAAVVAVRIGRLATLRAIAAEAEAERLRRKLEHAPPLRVVYAVEMVCSSDRTRRLVGVFADREDAEREAEFFQRQVPAEADDVTYEVREVEVQ